MFDLVQRLDLKYGARDEPCTFKPVVTGTGFDAWFGCEYMHNPDFGRSVPRAYRRMHTVRPQVIPVVISRRGITRTVYFVASTDPTAYASLYDDDNGDFITSFDRVVEMFREWFAPKQPFAEEPTYFEMFFENKFPDWMEGQFFPETIAWWSIRDNVAWTLDETIAHKLAVAFEFEPPAQPEEVVIEVLPTGQNQITKRGGRKFGVPVIYLIEGFGRYPLHFYESIAIGDDHLVLRYDHVRDVAFVIRYNTRTGGIRYKLDLERGRQYVLGVMDHRVRPQHQPMPAPA